MVSPSDWVLIGCTIILGAIALFGPYLNDFWKRKRLAPKLKIIFNKESPYIQHPPNKNIYYYLCFQVKNDGVSIAKDCEIIIEEFYYTNKKGNLIKDNKNFPAKLEWICGSDRSCSSIDILPKTGNFFSMCSIASTSDPNYKNKIILTISTERILMFASGSINFPLKHLKIKIVVYSENAKKCEQYVEIESPGIWKESKEQIFKEMKITLS